MSYAGAGRQPANGQTRKQQEQGQQGSSDFRPPIAPGPPGFQQSPNPQYLGTPGADQQYNGASPGYMGQPYGQPAQSPGYFPPQGGPGAPSFTQQDPVGNLASQMGGMNVGGTAPPPSRPGKRRDRHAHHNIEQSSVGSQALNQSAGEAPQFLNQQPDASHPYAAQQSFQQNSQFDPASQTQQFSPGLKAPPQPYPNQSQQVPVPSGTGVSAQGRVDPEQIPSIPRQRDSAAQYYLDHVYPTMEMHVPPPGAVPFVAHDQGNSSPKYARMTLNNIPHSSDALTQTGLPLGLLLQPFAPLQPGERPIPVLDFGDVGPPRCRRCRAYINPFMIFKSGGNKVVCNMCTFPNEVSQDYFAPTDPSGTRVDRAQRLELTTGTVEYLVPKEYWAKEPVGLRWLFVIDVSQDAVDKGYLEAFCRGVSLALYGEDDEITGEEKDEEDETATKRSIPRGSKVGFVAYDKAVYYYNCHVSLSGHA